MLDTANTIPDKKQYIICGDFNIYNFFWNQYLSNIQNNNNCTDNFKLLIEQYLLTIVIFYRLITRPVQQKKNSRNCVEFTNIYSTNTAIPVEILPKLRSILDLYIISVDLETQIYYIQIVNYLSKILNYLLIKIKVNINLVKKSATPRRNWKRIDIDKFRKYI